MFFITILLQTPVTSKYAPAPWYFRWLESLPLEFVIGLAVLGALLWLLKAPIETFFNRMASDMADRVKASSKEPASPADLTRKANKAIVLEQAAERLRMQVDCDHVSVYACQNGEYLRSGEGIDKFVMQAEAVDEGLPRYMDTERTVYAQDLPRTVLALERQPYLLLWAEHCDDWKVNKMMRERGYDSSIAVFVRRPIPAKGGELGIIGMYVVSWRDCLLYTHHQEDSLPKNRVSPQRLADSALTEKEKAALLPSRLIDESTELLMTEYANTFSYTM